MEGALSRKATGSRRTTSTLKRGNGFGFPVREKTARIVSMLKAPLPSKSTPTWRRNTGVPSGESRPNELEPVRNVPGSYGMIDRAARDQLSRSLRHLIAGRISNDQFENSTPESDQDPAIQAFAGMAWLLYSDTKQHRLIGRHSIDPDARREVLRWILFLDSDFDYRWPRMHLPGLSPSRRVRPALTRWLNWPNAISCACAAEFLAAGDHNAWPFISRSEHKHALRNPRRLAGRQLSR